LSQTDHKSDSHLETPVWYFARASAPELNTVCTVTKRSIAIVT